jgi:hypothetical protein
MATCLSQFNRDLKETVEKVGAVYFLRVAVKYGKSAPALARWDIREQPIEMQLPILPVRRYVPSFSTHCRH